MINKVILTGFMIRDLHFSLTQEGREIADFPFVSISCWEGKTREWVSHKARYQILVLYPPVIGWIRGLIKKGDRVYVKGNRACHCQQGKCDESHIKSRIIVVGDRCEVELLASASTSKLDLKSEKSPSKPEENFPNPSSLTSTGESK